MKEMFISDLENYYGKEIKFQALVKDVSCVENRNNEARQEILLADKSGTIIGKAWMELMNEAYYEMKHKVVNVMGKVNVYHGRPEISVIAMKEITQYEWKDFVLSISDEECNKIGAEIKKLINRVSDETYKALLNKILSNQNLKKMAGSIAEITHHNYCGGLLKHTLETCKHALMLAENKIDAGSPYPIEINIDLVITGALLHDIGALNTFESCPASVLTERGLLVPANVDSVLYVTTYNNQLPKEQKVSSLGPLNHILLAAGDKKNECINPKTMEAIIVREANRVSCQLDGLENAFYDSDKLYHDERSSVYSKLNATTVVRGVNHGTSID